MTETEKKLLELYESLTDEELADLSNEEFAEYERLASGGQLPSDGVVSPEDLALEVDVSDVEKFEENEAKKVVESVENQEELENFDPESRFTKTLGTVQGAMSAPAKMLVATGEAAKDYVAGGASSGKTFGNLFSKSINKSEDEKGVFRKIAEEPEFIPTMAMPMGAVTRTTGKLFSKAPKIIQAAAKGGAEGLAEETIRSVVKGNVDAENIGAGVGVGSLFGGLSKPIVDNIGKLARGGISRATGASYDALEMGSTAKGRKLLEESEGQVEVIADEIIEEVNNFEKHIPEWKEIKRTLSEMPEVDITPVHEAIEKSFRVPEGRRKLQPWELKANAAMMNEFMYDSKMMSEIDDLEKVIDVEYFNSIAKADDRIKPEQGLLKSGKPGLEAIEDASSGKELSTVNIVENNIADETIGEADNRIFLDAEGVYGHRKAMDEDIGPQAFDKIPGGNAVHKAVTKAKLRVRKALKDALLKTAEESGNKSYKKNMEILADKLQKKDALSSKLGKSTGAMQTKADNLVRNITNKNKKRVSKALDDIDELTGNLFGDRARAASYAEKFGEGGTPGLFPLYGTGAGHVSTIPLTLGASSPIISSGLFIPAGKAGAKVVKAAKPYGATSKNVQSVGKDLFYRNEKKEGGK